MQQQSGPFVKQKKAFVCGNWPQVQGTFDPYSLQVEQKALEEQMYSLEQTRAVGIDHRPDM